LAGSVEVSFPSGPWVLVLGMHRSGTSALTGALGALGLALPAPDDLVTGRYDNPVHYESRSLTDVGDAVLRALGGSWSAPPALAPGWERSDRVLPLATPAAAAARRAFPGDGPVAWKDPRLCLLLPWWRSLLPSPAATVLLWRDPEAVARSLRTRQGFPLSLGLALWERYNRAALDALAGHPTHVVRFEELLADPRSAVEAVAVWLAGPAGVPVATADGALAAAAATVSQELVHPPPGAGGGSRDLPEVVVRTGAALQERRGPHQRLPAAELPEPPPWMADVIQQRHDYEDLYARYMRYIRLRRRIPLAGLLGRLRARSRPGGAEGR